MALIYGIRPLPFPVFLNDGATLQLMLGLGLLGVGTLVFSLWKEKFASLGEDERAHFIVFSFFGSSWVLAVLAGCGGLFFVIDSLIQIAK